ncbi:Dihydrolipoamide dehydrogenase [Candidatus Phytoplasma mali]|uniref:Dihydrolipoyl dehydrogenase n=1 Tax=Phytoplasma mali (strain AT) TaxID=482235 RepID=B3R0H6_PHYMT|nr:dihydrolipoyl dehydrogenase [Candidatus Phytoplasma mali]CAP18340.1 Dihydrolipoamide dehydrogenase [Candidatus Phytoplasma mali]
MKNYDIVVIGGGPGGYVAAIKASQLGAKVALVEKHKIGGVCLNYGCIPTKTYFKSAKVFKEIKKSSYYGLKIQGDISFNWKDILLRKNKVVQKLNNGVEFLLKKNKVDLYYGFAEALTSKTVKIGNDLVINTRKLIISTGASTFIPPIEGLQESYEKGIVKTSKELLELEDLPKKIVIIGGGVIAIEFATIFNAFGSEIIILERQSNILNNMDKDIIEGCYKKIKNDGIDVLNNVEVMRIKDNKIFYSYNNQNKELIADTILIATGFKPNLSGLEKLNLNIEKNSIVTDNFLRTSLPDVYAVGDVNGRYMLAHVASHEGIIAVNHALGKEENANGINYDRIPSCVYSFPEIATIGLTEQEAKLKGMDYKISKLPLTAIGKSLADGETEGFAKLIVGKQNLEIIGMHIYAYNATELISEISVAMELEGTAYELANAIHPHPTLSELIFETYLGAIDKPIHM